MSTVIKVENLSKRYRLGVINRDMLYKDLQSRWAKFRGKEDPNAVIGLKHDQRLEHGDEFWALRNVDLEVKEGEILGIIGRNGAGKSTLLKILSQITAPTEGRIKVKGRIASLLEVGTGFHPELTGRENVYLNGAILGMTRKEVRSKFDEIVAFADIDEFIDTPVKRYSSGMYVRLAFAVAAHLDPEILIIDEVLAVGDTQFQSKCIGRMEVVAAGGKTIIFVSHQVSAVQRLCGQVAWMHGGTVKLVGNTDEVLRRHAEEVSHNESDLLDPSRLKSRAGSGVVRVAAITCLSRGGQKTTHFQSGDKCIFEVCLLNNSNKPQEDISLSIEINDHLGQRLLYFHTAMLGVRTFIGVGSKKLHIILNHLPLAAGNYSVSVFVGKHNYEVYDYVEFATQFTVNEGDFFGTRHPGFPALCKVLQEFSVKDG
jgi:lipopolysaccharide transport system ATP-binding protein